MRVLQFGRFDFKEHKGGVQFYADSLTHELRKEIEVDLLVSAIKPKTRFEKAARGWMVAVASWGVWFSVPFSPTLPFWALWLCWTRKYDLIHLNFPDPLAMLAAFFLPRKIPVVVTWHSDVIRQKIFLPFYLPVLKLFMKRVARVIVATPYHLPSCPQLQMQDQIEKKIEVIPFGIDPKLWQIDDEIKKRAEQVRQQYVGRFLLFSFGRHVPYKGFIYLLEAMKDLPQAVLLLGGEGPLTHEFQKFIEDNKLQSRVSLIGLLSMSQLKMYLKACDLFCFPSIDRTEAFGYTQVEAMLCGKPVLSTNLGNGVNYVNLDQVTGRVVEPLSPQQLKEAILSLQQQPAQLQKYADAAHQRAMKEFNVLVMGARTLQFFRDLVAAKKR